MLVIAIDDVHHESASRPAMILSPAFGIYRDQKTDGSSLISSPICFVP